MHAMYMVVGSLITQKYLTDVQLINLLGVGSYLTCINIALHVHGVTVVNRQLAIQVLIGSDLKQRTGVDCFSF